MPRRFFKKLGFLSSLCVFILLFTFVNLCFTAQESITLTTYYPAPYGIYKELRADQMSIGQGYRNAPLSNGMLIVEGNVSIGTPSPQGRLHVDPLSDTGSSDGFPDTDDGSADDFIIMPDGKVGIGTIEPTSRLDVIGEARFKTNALDNHFLISNAPDWATPNPKYDNVGLDLVQTESGILGARILLNGFTGPERSGGRIDFYTKPPGDESVIDRLAPRMTIDEDGNVGIGTPDPQRPLHIVGNSSFGPATLVISNSDAPSGDQTLAIGAGMDDPRGDFFISRMTDDGSAPVRTDFSINASDGNVGIGTKTPGSYDGQQVRLDVGKTNVDGYVAADDVWLKSPKDGVARWASGGGITEIKVWCDNIPSCPDGWTYAGTGSIATGASTMCWNGSGFQQGNDEGTRICYR